MRCFILRLLVALLFPAFIEAGQSLSGGSGSGVLPSGAPYSNLQNFRIQFRIHGGWSYNGSYQLLFGTRAYALRLDPTGTIFVTSWYDQSSACDAAVSPGRDVIGVVNRSPSGLTIEFFDTQRGNTLVSNQCGITAGIPNDAGGGITVGGFNGALAYIRAYSTTVPVGTPPGNRFDGDLWDYELEGNGTDQSGHANLTFTGGAFSNTPVYPPAASWNPWPALNVLRAGGAGLALKSSSFDPNDNAVMSYFWQQLGGPAPGSFSTRTAATATFNAPVAGTYQVQLTVRDSGGLSATAIGSVGAVASDNNGVVISGSTPAMDALLGPVVIANGQYNPWTYGDLAEIAVLDVIANGALANPPSLGAAISGTVTLTNAPPCLVGTGTRFTSELTPGGLYVVGWDSIDGPGTGRFLAALGSITDDAHACFTGVYQYAFPTPSAARVYPVPPGTPTSQVSWWQNGNVRTFWNFYDGGLAKLREYSRTGLSTYLAQARQLIDYNWTWMLDHGYAWPPPRGASLVSQFWRALDGHPERFPSLYNWLSYMINSFHFLPAGCPYCDTREAGYTQWFIAAGARADPDPVRHAQYCSWVSTYAANWMATQTAQGYWAENVFSGNPGYIYAWANWPASPKIYGASPWRMNIAIRGLEASYEVLNDTSAAGCNNPTLAVSLLSSITSAVSFVYNYGYDNFSSGNGRRGIFYDIQYQSNAQGGCGQGAGPNCYGTASINLGSSTVTGSGTNFCAVTGGAGFIGIAGAGPDSIYKVVSCASDTQLTITPNFGSFGETASVSGHAWFWAPPGNTNCGGSLATYCLAPGSRDLDRLAAGAAGWLYNQTGNATHKAWADEWYSATLGGPAVGPNAAARVGSFDTGQPCAGPGCDGYITDTIAALPNCGVLNPPPCTQGGDVFANLGKNANEAFGAPGIDNELAWRVGGLQPAVSRTLYVGFNLSSVPRAAKVQIALTYPSGAVVNAECTSSPCLVAADARQGDHLMQLKYLSASGATLAVQDATVAKVF